MLDKKLLLLKQSLHSQVESEAEASPTVPLIGGVPLGAIRT
ncbi:MAG: hypothetical protein SVY53_03945 [Chloroflexota bacterium]|nr:hypothetical protein [Chloroflexota bacterium]